MKDELNHFGTAGLPASDDPNINNTSGAIQPTGERTPPFGGAAEYAQPTSNLPMQVRQAEIRARSEGRGVNVWTGEGNEEV